MRARSRWLALGAALVGSAPGCESGERPTGEDAAGATAEVAMPSAVDIVAAVPRPDDAPVLRLGTPESSRAAQPPFVRGSSGYVPAAHPDVARALFEAADATARTGAAFDRDLAACRLIRHGDAPGLRRRDRRAARLRVTLTWGEARYGVSDAEPAGADEAWLLVPLVRLASGDPWSASVRTGEGDHELSGVFDGAIPWRARADDFELECRRVDEAARAEAVRDALWSLDRKLALLSIRSGEASESLRDIERFLDPVSEAAEPVAALVGWDDPRLRRRFDRRAELEARLVDAVAADRGETIAAAKAPGEWVGVGRMGRRLEVRAESMTCEIADARAGEDAEPHDAWRCEVTLSIDNGARGDRSLDVAGDVLLVGGAVVSLQDRFGRPARVRWPEGRSPDAIDRAAILTTRVVLEPTTGHAGLQNEPGPALPVTFELVSERRRHRLLQPARRQGRLGRLPRPGVCEGPRAPAACTGGSSYPPRP